MGQPVPVRVRPSAPDLFSPDLPPRARGSCRRPAPREASGLTLGPPTPPPLPDDSDLGRWLAGDEDATIDGIFWQLAPHRFDRLIARLHQRGRLPHHQDPATGPVPEPEVLHRLPEIDRLRRRYPRSGLASVRLHAIENGWRDLAGKRPALWTVGDLLVAVRRAIHDGDRADPSALVAAARDIWRDLPLPHGERQLGLLLPCLEHLRDDARRRRAGAREPRQGPEPEPES